MRLVSRGLIDRSKPVQFTFDGHRYQGYAGDTVASALLAAGQRLMGRSFKYHRPRGVLTAGSEEPNALVTVRRGAGREPNVRATVQEIYDGLDVRSQNAWPSLRFDAMAVNDLAAPFLGAGFYYKTFMWPAAFWEKLYEPIIRRAAGLGGLSGAPEPDAAHDRDRRLRSGHVRRAGADGHASGSGCAAPARVFLANCRQTFGSGRGRAGAASCVSEQ